MEIEIITTIFQLFSKQKVNLSLFCKIDIGKGRVDRFTGSRQETDIDMNLNLNFYGKP